MKTKINLILFVLLLFCAPLLKADDEPKLKVYNKSEINKIAENYLNNNLKIENPAVVDVDNDGVFDILNFTEKGNVEYYRNAGTTEKPDFVLVDKKYGDVEIHSMLHGIPKPVFFADKDGDNDVDLFVIMDKEYDTKTQQQQYKISALENTMDLDHYTLITVILILLIVVLVVALAK
jgi:hypothetical protein